VYCRLELLLTKICTALNEAAWTVSAGRPVRPRRTMVASMIDSAEAVGLREVRFVLVVCKCNFSQTPIGEGVSYTYGAERPFWTIEQACARAPSQSSPLSPRGTVELGTRRKDEAKRRPLCLTEDQVTSDETKLYAYSVCSVNSAHNNRRTHSSIRTKRRST